jgi:hypothetical protein
MKHYAMKAYGGVDLYIHIFLISVLAGSERSDSLSGRFIPGEEAPVIHWIGGWVYPRAGLDDMEKRKFFTLAVIVLSAEKIGLCLMNMLDLLSNVRIAQIACY